MWAIPIAEHTSRGDLCYEPFIGSGTHHVAAERPGRVCYGLELQPAFVAVALERLKDMGLEPRLVEEALSDG
jgi:DNA modification methylase